MNCRLLIVFLFIGGFPSLLKGQSAPAGVEPEADPLAAYKQLYLEAYTTYQQEPEQGLDKALRALQFAQQAEHPKGVANSSFLVGLIYSQLQHHTEAYQAYRTARALFKKAGNTEYVLRTEWNLGNVMTMSQNLGRGETHFRAIEHQITRFLSPSEQADFYSDFGELYFRSKAYSQAIEQFEKSLKAYPYDLYHQGVMSYYLGKCWAYLGRKVKGDSLIQSAIQILQDQEDYYLVGYAYAHIGYECIKQGQLDSAIWAYESSLALTVALPDPSSVRIEWHESLHEAYKEKGDLQKAFSVLQNGYNLLEKNQPRVKYKSVFLSLISLAIELNYPELAQEYTAKLEVYDQALTAEQEALKLLLQEQDFAQVDAQVKADGHEQDIQHERKIWFWVLALVVFTAGGLLFFFWRGKRKAEQLAEKHKQEAHRIRQESLDFTARWSKTTEKLKHLRP